MDELSPDHPFLRLQAAMAARDWLGVRTAGAELVDNRSAEVPAELRAGLHYLVADAIVTMGMKSHADAEEARSHLRAAIPGLQTGSDQLGMAYYYLGKAMTALGTRCDEVVLAEALDAFDRAESLFAGTSGEFRVAGIRDGRGRALETLGAEDLSTLELALTDYRRSYEVSKAAGRPLNQGTAAYHVGRILVRIAEYASSAARLAEAVPYLEEAERTYRSARLDDQEADAIRLLVRARAGGFPSEHSSQTTTSHPVTPPDAAREGAAPALDPMPAEVHAQAQAGIRSAETRPIFLRKWIEHHVAADREREAFLRRFILDPAVSEVIAKAAEAETKQDPELHEVAKAMAEDARHYFECLLEQDRANSTHEAALGILRSHLDEKRPFVLFLRNFDIALSKGRLSKDLEEAFSARLSEVASIRYVNVVQVRGSSEETRFADAMPDDLPIVAISDIGDVFVHRASKRVSGLRVLSNEWDLVAAMLIGEATAIVLFVQGLTDGLELELRYVQELGANRTMSVLMVQPDDDPLARLVSGGDPEARKLSFAVLSEAMKRRFDEQLVQVALFPEDDRRVRQLASKAVAHISR